MLRNLVMLSAALCCGVSLTSCGSEPKAAAKPERPPLPKLNLRPMLAELRSLAKTLPQPDEKAQKELREYADIALGLVESDQRMATRVQRALLEHKDAWFVLEPALTHEVTAVRQRAAWLCGESKQTVLIVPLLLRLKYELDPVGMIWVADALAKLGNDAGLMYLASAFARQETANQAGQMAIQALKDRGVEVPEEPTWQDLTGLLKEQADNWKKTGKSAREDTAAPDETILKARLAHHLQTPEGTQLRPVDDARFILTRLGVVGVPALMTALEADEHYLRTMPLQVLAELGTAATSATDAIMPLLGDPLTASYAVRALGEVDAQKALPHLRPLLDDVDSEMRAAASQALGLLGDTLSKKALTVRLNDANESMDVRVGAAFGLLCLGKDEAAQKYLDERSEKKDYHEPILTRLLERLASRSGE